jgi:hypothetical protein
MFHRLNMTIAAAALLVVPGVAAAQTTATGHIAVNSTVAGACGLGAPAQAVLDLHDLSGTDGRLDSSKRSSAVQATTVIADAWCNTPHSLTFAAKPMSLQETRTYAQPSYMARDITYDATLVGWPVDLSRRPKSGDDDVSIAMHGAYAPASPGLVLNISRLETLTAAKVEDSTLMLEAGHYKGTVTITLATTN